MTPPAIPQELVFQHEFDHEPSYVCDASNPEAELIRVEPGNLPLARAVAVLPRTLRAFEALLLRAQAQLPQGADKIGLDNCTLLAGARAALRDNGYEF